MKRPLAILLALSLCVGQALALIEVSGLKCEKLQDPQGIDVTRPRLSWVLESNERGVKQTAYQILVASREALLKEGQADLWDSGKVLSDHSILVTYSGKPLSSHEQCVWKVRVWDAGGRASAWSRTARWSIGILQSEQWRANWIGQDGVDKTNMLTGTSWIWYPEGNPVEAAPIETNWFRRVITIPADRNIKQAVFEYTGDNECRGWQES